MERRNHRHLHRLFLLIIIFITVTGASIQTVALHDRTMSFVENQIVHLARAHCVVRGGGGGLVLPDGLSKISAALSKSGRSPSLKKFATDIEEYKRPGGHYSIGVLEFILQALDIPHERVDLERVEGKIVAIHNEEAAAAAAASAAIHNEEAVVPAADDDELGGLSYGDLLAKAGALAAEARDKHVGLDDLMKTCVGVEG